MSNAPNKFELIASRASFACCLFVGAATSEFELLQWNAEMSETHARSLAERRHMAFAGVMGIVDGLPRTALAVELDDATMSAICRAFVQRIEAAICWIEQSVGCGVN